MNSTKLTAAEIAEMLETLPVDMLVEILGDTAPQYLPLETVLESDGTIFRGSDLTGREIVKCDTDGRYIILNKAAAAIAERFDFRFISKKKVLVIEDNGPAALFLVTDERISKGKGDGYQVRRCGSRQFYTIAITAPAGYFGSSVSCYGVAV